ncbi:MAG: UDP-N-acetylmuramate--L-alanine ligase [Thermodesulfobacteriota bacterium]|nr:UDP-N-acetylmuramate--L-alanine ligase [Thermodesulfobacteriota bacterium]
MYQKDYQIHFVGIGGIGMSGIAEVLMGLGYRVSGSDLKSGPILERLENSGAVIYKGHKKEQVASADVVVTSTAIPKNNCEVVEAEKRAVPIIQRAEMLAEIMRFKYSIAVSGAHGKTSTTAMISGIINRAGLDPTVIVGGLLNNLDTNALHGKGDFIVVEADESDGSFLKYSPAIAAVTNIDLEHLDFYAGIEDIKETFVKFINSVPFYGLAVLCLDNEHIQEILPKVKVRYITFGETAQADLQAKEISFKDTRGFFKVIYKGEPLGKITLNLAGRHNISNALAAVAVALELNIGFNTIKTALEEIEGVKRRLEIKGESNGIMVLDDYGHHPTEIKATLDAVRESWSDKRLVVVFQPHRYSRTRALFDAFTRSFYRSDQLIILPIYAASEEKIEGVDGQSLCKGIEEHGHKNVSFVRDFDECLSMLLKSLKKGDLVLTLGAGDVYSLGEELCKRLQGTAPAALAGT